MLIEEEEKRQEDFLEPPQRKIESLKNNSLGSKHSSGILVNSDRFNVHQTNPQGSQVAIPYPPDEPVSYTYYSESVTEDITDRSKRKINTKLKKGSIKSKKPR